MKTLITKLLGGLGNQMFQYAAGRRLSLDNNMRLLVDTSILEDHSPGRHEVNRHYGLGIFKLEVEKATPLQRWFYNAQGLPLPVKVLARCLKPWSSKLTCRERSFSFDDGLLREQPAPRYIHGLWQSYRYFEPVAGAIAGDFEFRDPLPSALAGMGSEISCHESVCLNVRRGDYVHGSCATSMGFTGLDYYRSACRVMRQRLGTEPAYFVFSDDIEWCVQNLDWLGPRTEFVDHEYAGDHFVNYLQLMSLCPNFIIPNSTFGWWAAWLSRAPDKKVIAPARWFTDPSVDTSDLCPPSWQRL
jgi:hypothetical protein